MSTLPLTISTRASNLFLMEFIFKCAIISFLKLHSPWSECFLKYFKLKESKCKLKKSDFAYIFQYPQDYNVVHIHGQCHFQFVV